jgi:hypothetical protein
VRFTTPRVKIGIGRDVMQEVEGMPSRDGKGCHAGYRDGMHGGMTVMQGCDVCNAVRKRIQCM